MKQILLFTIAICMAGSLFAQNEHSPRQFFSVSAGWRMPFFGTGGRQLTDPLLSTSQQVAIFTLGISSEIKNHWGLDIKCSYFEKHNWMNGMESELRETNADALVTVYPVSKQTKMSTWSLMAGPSYHRNYGKNIWIANFWTGIGNQNRQELSVEVKTRGTHDLETWSIRKRHENKTWRAYKNLFSLTLGGKYIRMIGKSVGVCAGLDLQLSQRTADFTVIQTQEITGISTTYQVNGGRAGVAVIPSVGLVKGFY